MNQAVAEERQDSVPAAEVAETGYSGNPAAAESGTMRRAIRRINRSGVRQYAQNASTVTVRVRGSSRCGGAELTRQPEVAVRCRT